MSSGIAMFLFVIFQVGNFFLSKFVADGHGFWAGVAVFALLFLISAFALGKFASKRLIVTYEDQQREKRKQK